MPAKLITLLRRFKGLGVSSVEELIELLAQLRGVKPDSISAMETVSDDEVAALEQLVKGNGAAAEVKKKPPQPKRVQPARRLRRKISELVEEKEVPPTPAKPPPAKVEPKPDQPTPIPSTSAEAPAQPKAEAKPAKTKPSEKELEGKVIEREGSERVMRPRRVPRRLTPTAKAAAPAGEEAPAEVKPRSQKRIFRIKGVAGPHPKTEVERFVKITGEMGVREVSEKTGVRTSDILGFLNKELGIEKDTDDRLDPDEIALVCEHFKIKYQLEVTKQEEEILEQFAEVVEKRLEPRPPVVTIMGHVDHGKTTLLDYIRHTKVAEQEAGGITQHIGAYQVEKDGKTITFIDTPGHEAFTAMRARGSQVTDIVVLVVAADDGVMPQTVEAIEHARAAEVPIIVALNKIDKPNANPEKVLSQLSDQGLVPEEWGGDTPVVKVSALTGQGVDELLEIILITADLLELKADPKTSPWGTVLESEVHPHLGVLATVIVQQGTFKKGGYVVAGTAMGRVRKMEDFTGKEVKEALPSMPVRIIGFEELPEAGERCYYFSKRRQAEALVEERRDRERMMKQRESVRLTLEKLQEKLLAGDIKELNLVIKADVHGSMEALAEAIGKIQVEGTKINIIRKAVGEITESDIMLASASQAIVIGFNTRITTAVKRIAEREGVEVRLYEVIYDVVEDLEKALLGLLEPEYVKEDIGRLEIRAIFRKTKNEVIAGGYVLDGVVRRGAQYRLTRQGELIYEGTLNSLKRFKEDVSEVQSGYECGIMIEGTGDVKEGDIMEFYELREVRPELSALRGERGESTSEEE